MGRLHTSGSIIKKKRDASSTQKTTKQKSKILPRNVNNNKQKNLPKRIIISHAHIAKRIASAKHCHAWSYQYVYMIINGWMNIGMWKICSSILHFFFIHHTSKLHSSLNMTEPFHISSQDKHWPH